jgi:hypothetical protein
VASITNPHARVLFIELGQRIGLHVWCHGLSHSSITAALDVAAKAGIGLDKVRAHRRHAAIGTLLIHADEHDRIGTQRTPADLVANALDVQPGPS